MKYLLDTNTCIKYLNGQSDSIRHYVELMSPHDIVVCSIVKAELFYGAMKSLYPEKNLGKQQNFLSACVSLPFDDKAAHAYGNIRAQLEKEGTPIGPNDLLIAAIAISNNVILVSNNIREFGRLKNLKLENWEAYV